MKSRESGDERLHPSLFGRMGARYVYLKGLRDGLKRFIQSYLQDANNLNLVDIGCGNKPYQPLFEGKIKHYYGVDFPDNKAAEIHLNSDFTIDLTDASMDLALSTQVLEHVENPTLYLAETHRILKPEGKLILSTHGYWMYHPDPTDFWRWTSSGLRKVVEEAGFEILEFQGILGRSSMGMQLVQDGLIFKLPRMTWPIIVPIFQILIKILDSIHSAENRSQDACTFMLIAKKRP